MSSLLQTKEWAALRQTQGWQAHEVEGISVLQRKLFLGKSFLYAPEVQLSDINNIENFLVNTKEIAQKNNILFFRLEILDNFDEKIVQKLKENGFVKAFEEIQPEYRQIIDITKSEDEILSQMKEKGRYNIRVAQKHNIVIEKSDPSTPLRVNELSAFYEIFTQTAKRDGFHIRTKAYFAKLLEILTPKNYAEILIARLPSPDGSANGGQAKYQGKPIAAEIVTYYNDTATYLYGASSNENREVMAPYLLHFQAIKNAKEKGCKYYDLLAVAPEGVEKHKYTGISRFKRQFGGKTVHIVGSYDLIYQPFLYWKFKILEKLRRK